MAQDWERVQPRASRLGVAAAGMAAVAVVGLLIRPAEPQARPPAALEVGQEAPAPAPARTPRISRTPGEARPDDDLTDEVPPTSGQLHGTWHRAAAPPGAFPEETVFAVEGMEAIYVVGGQSWGSSGRTTFHDLVWRYSVSDDQWTALPPPPLDPRGLSAVVWTGTELVVWGGSGQVGMFADGAAYDSEQDRWRHLEPSPLSPRSGSAAVLTDDGVVILGGWDHAWALADTALWDPDTGLWQAQHDLPVRAVPWGSMPAGRLGERVMVWPGEQGNPDQSVPWWRVPGTGEWLPTEIPDQGIGEQITAPSAASGGDVHGLLLAYRDQGFVGDLVALPSGSDTWERVSPLPIRPHALAGQLVADRYYVVIDGEGRGIAHDLHDGRWLELPRASRSVGHGMHIMTLPDGFLLLPANQRFVLDPDTLQP